MNILKSKEGIQIHSNRVKMLNQAGDTIVEVFVCLAVIGAVFGGAFAATRSAQLGVRNSQEHTEALQLAQNQVEQLRNAASTNASLFSQSGSFCMLNEQIATGANCVQDSSGNSPPASNEVGYTISITDCKDTSCDNQVLGSDQFTVQVTWDEISGGTAQVNLIYRIYNGLS
jgi:type II secretory pathway pseudopilin PulG